MSGFEFWKRIEFQQKYRDWDQDQFGYPFPAYPAPGERCLLEVGGNGNGDKICLVVGDEGTVSEDELWIVNLSSLFFMGIPGPLVELVYDLATRSGRFHIIDQALLPEEPEKLGLATCSPMGLTCDFFDEQQQRGCDAAGIAVGWHEVLQCVVKRLQGRGVKPKITIGDHANPGSTGDLHTPVPNFARQRCPSCRRASKAAGRPNRGA